MALPNFRPWKNQVGEIARYFRLYGGWSALIASPYPQFSLVFGIVLMRYGGEKFDPATLTISIIPNLLGFTVGALAIILAFSSSDIFVHLAEKGKESSYFMLTVANFVHFILIQVLSILISIFTIANPNNFLQTANAIMLTYSILTPLAAVITLFQMATIFNKSRSKNNPNNVDGNEK